MGEEKATPFVMQEGYYKNALAIPDPIDQLCFLKSIIEFGLYGTEPDFSQMSEVGKAVAEVGFLYYVKPMVNKSQERYKTSQSNGRTGGNPNFKKGKPNPYYPKKDNRDNLKDNPAHNPEDNPTDNHNKNSNKNTNKSNSYYSTGDVDISVMPNVATPEKEVKPPNPIDSQFRPVFD